MISLTKSQRITLIYLSGFYEVYGRGPTYQEIAKATGAKSKGPAHRKVHRLRERGALTRPGTEVRGQEIAIPRAPDGAPLYFVPAGESA